MKRIPLTQGQFTLVDDEDFEKLSKHKWYADFHHGNWYAVRNGWKGEDKKKFTMGRIILNAPKGKQIDHRNNNGLDNRKSNLRICTHAENQHNQKPRKNQTSKYKGVSWHKRERRWRVSIKNEGKPISLGQYKSEKDAAKAYDAKAKELFGEFANLNFKE